MQYRVRPMSIEAILWDGTPEAARAFIGGTYKSDWQYQVGLGWLTIPAEGPDEAPYKGETGDFIVKETDGQFRPYKPEVFRRLYEPICEDCFNWSIEGKDCILAAPETGCPMLFGPLE